MVDLLDDLTPTEYLVMEVLAARWRLGEECWTFPAAVAHPLGRLARRGYLDHKSGPVQKTRLAWLTDEGMTAWRLDRPYLIDDVLIGRTWLPGPRLGVPLQHGVVRYDALWEATREARQDLARECSPDTDEGYEHD